MKRKHSESSEEKERSTKKSKREKHEKHKHKKNKHKHKKRKDHSPIVKDEHIGPTIAPSNEKISVGDTIVDHEKRKAFQPMTKEQWEKEQNKITRVYDEETGRHRLVRGSGEIIEEIVSRERQREINKRATAMDGHFYLEHAKKLFK